MVFLKGGNCLCLFSVGATRIFYPHSFQRTVFVSGRMGDSDIKYPFDCLPYKKVRIFVFLSFSQKISKMLFSPFDFEFSKFWCLHPWLKLKYCKVSGCDIALIIMNQKVFCHEKTSLTH